MLDTDKDTVLRLTHLHGLNIYYFYTSVSLVSNKLL